MTYIAGAPRAGRNGDSPMFQVTRLFIAGNLKGLTYTEISSVARKVGQVVAKPIGGSPYRIVSCKAVA